MHRRLLFAALLVCLAVTVAHAQVTYFVDGYGNIGTINLSTGVASVIGAGTVPGNTGLGLTPTNQIYEYNMSNQLMSVDPATGVTTLVGTGSVPHPNWTTTGGMTDGRYFGLEANSGNLYSIDLATGATTLVGTTSVPGFLPFGCGFTTSLAGSDSVLYYTVGYQGWNCANRMPDTLYVVDPASGATTYIGPVGVNRIVGSAYVAGTLYGFTADGREFSIDPTTAAPTFLANTTAMVYGAASTTAGVNKCPLSQGYWKNHPGAWPVASLTLGGQTYSASELMAILNTPIGTGSSADASLILADQLIAARLDIANGSNPAPVSSTIADANTLLKAFSGKLPYHVAPSSPAGKSMTSDASILNLYNNDQLTPNCTP